MPNVPLTVAEEYQAVRFAIQLLNTADPTTGIRRDRVSFQLGDMSVTYAQSQLGDLRVQLNELARQLSVRNIRKRTSCDFSGGTSPITLPT